MLENSAYLMYIYTYTSNSKGARRVRFKTKVERIFDCYVQVLDNFNNYNYKKMRTKDLLANL